MTEQEWLECGDPTPMLEFLQPDEKARKTRLFKCACCRRLWHLLTDERSRDGVIVAEQIADNAKAEEQLGQAVEKARAVSESKRLRMSGGPHDPLYSLHTAAQAASDTTANEGFIALGIARWTANALGAEAQASAKAPPYSKRGKAAFDAAHKQAFLVMCNYIRDIFGNPFSGHPFRVNSTFTGLVQFRDCCLIDPRWYTSTVSDLAKTIYQERAFDRMPILGDALMDAGCDNDGILSHCRGDGPHVRACWVVDTLMGRDPATQGIASVYPNPRTPNQGAEHEKPKRNSGQHHQHDHRVIEPRSHTLEKTVGQRQRSTHCNEFRDATALFGCEYHPHYDR